MSKFFLKFMLIMLVTMSVVLFAGDNELIGAGASFPYPLYSKMFDVYYKLYNIKVNYQSIGSGGGVRQIKAKSVDFGASDGFLNDNQLKEFDKPIVHIPTCLGAVVISYNLPGNPQLKLTPDVLANIFLGKIKKWNDPAIQNINPGVKLPKNKIIVVHRSDGSGTTFVFTDYLAKISSEWKNKVGFGKSVKWPAGLGAKGNEGVSGLIKQMRGSIGYCELAYANHNKMPVALIKNKSGKYIKPELQSISAAANFDIPADTRVSITNTEASDGYPISSFTWLLIYKEQNYKNRSLQKAKNLVELIKWMITDGQKYNEPLEYAKLPEAVKQKAIAILKSVTYNGKTILQ